MSNPPGGTRPGAAAAVVILAVAVDMFLYGSLVPLVPVLPAVDGSPSAAIASLMERPSMFLATFTLGEKDTPDLKT